MGWGNRRDSPETELGPWPQRSQEVLNGSWRRRGGGWLNKQRPSPSRREGELTAVAQPEPGAVVLKTKGKERSQEATEHLSSEYAVLGDMCTNQPCSPNLRKNLAWWFPTC